MNTSFRIVVAVTTLSLAAGAVWAMRPKPVEVEVSLVATAALEDTIADNGRARVRERYTVSTPVAGTLARLELHEGDMVEAGAVLARVLPLPTPLLDPVSRKATEQRLASTQDASEQALASVRRAEVAYDQAKADLVRMQALARQGAATNVQLDQAQAEVRMREAELASAEIRGQCGHPRDWASPRRVSALHAGRR